MEINNANVCVKLLVISMKWQTSRSERAENGLMSNADEDSEVEAISEWFPIFIHSMERTPFLTQCSYDGS